MAWVKVESSVPRNKKFVIAGPAPSWLWLCGLCYCQEGLTDGFISREALPYLGVKNSQQLAQFLVKAGLWEETDGGWLIHDYLKHNRSSRQVDVLKAKRKKAGEAGGRPVKANDEGARKQNGFECESIAVAVADGAPVVVLPSEEKKVTKEPSPNRDQWLLDLWNAYPTNRRARSRITTGLFNDQFNADPRPDESVWSDMWQGLLNQKQGYEWRVKGMVEGMDKWLEKGLWRNRHEYAPVSTVVSEKTARNLTAMETFIKAGER